MCSDPRERMLLSRNKEAERSVLGAVLVQPSTIGLVDLRPDEFFLAAHQAIYRQLQQLHARGVMADFVTLKNALSTAGQLDDVGGPAYVASLADGVPQATNIEHYARVVRDHAVRRSLVYAALEMIEAARSAASAEEALSLGEQALTRVGADASGLHENTADTQALLEAAGRLVDQVQRTGQPITGVATGLHDLDLQTLGMKRGKMIVAGARIGKGKSTLALNIARHAARTGTVLFWSGEMDYEEVGLRLLVSEAHVDGFRLQSGLPVAEATWAGLAAAMGELSPARLVVDEEAHRTVGQLRRLARRLQAVRQDLQAIVVDYIGLLKPERQRTDDSRTMDLAEMSRAIKVMARELRVPVLVLAQLKRELDQRAGSKRSAPTIADLGESSAMEKDADQVWLIDPDDDEGTAWIHVVKNRGGPRGKVKVAYFPEQYRFADLDTHHNEED